MKLGAKTVILLGFLVTSYVIGLLIFTRGFLLVRTMIHQNSSCEVRFATQADDLAHGGHRGCWSHARFKKAIVIIIDALRYDFVAYDTSLKSDVPAYKNKLKTIHQMLTRSPRSTRLYKFIADPPTTTLQRLKGLTTGSLPTFVDAGANFDSSEIKEDNWIDQLITQGKKVKFLGDDTWESLFPNRFYKSFSFPSFNVKDLHTVDNGILKHLYPELRRNDWDVVIAHFLGVDHCGHRFGPKHPAMAEKLQQMDQVIRNVSKLMKEDTVLLVLGDHGMTRTGDHGGDSEDELTSGLFVYSPAHLTSSAPSSEDEPQEVQQTDLVPTVSLLLGLPIPFSSLGTVIPELFSHCPWWDTHHNHVRQVFHTVKALHLNAMQVSQYLNTYAATSSDLPQAKFRQLQSSLKEAEAELQALVTGVAVAAGAESRDLVDRMLQLQDRYLTYLSQVRSMCQGVWAKFDLTSMVLGVVVVVGALMFNVALSFGWAPSGGGGGEEDGAQDKGGGEQGLPAYVPFVVGGVVVQVVYYVIHVMVFPPSVLPIMAYVVGALIIFGLAILLKKRAGEMWREGKMVVVDAAVATGVMLMCFCAFFSNSFVVYEDAVSHFLAQSLLWYTSLRVIVNSHRSVVKDSSVVGRWSRKVKQPSLVDIMERVTQPAVMTFALTLLCSALLRCSAYFRVCREEQGACEAPWFLQPLLTLTEEGSAYKNQRYFFSMLCVFTTVWLARRWLQHYGNLNRDGMNVVCVKFLLPVGAVACVLHWAIQALPQKELDSLPPWQQTLMARVVYACILVHLVVSLIQPLYIYIHHVTPSGKVSVPLGNRGAEQTVPFVYRQLQSYWHRKGDGADSQLPPAAYGLGSVYSSHLVSLSAALFLLLALLLGDGAGPSLALALWLLFGFLELSAAYWCGDTDSGSTLHQPAPWLTVVTHGVLSSVFFYATGHQATIPSIRFESAFTGFHGDFSNNIIPALIITLNTYAGPVFFAVVSPLLLFWPHLQGPLWRWIVAEKKKVGGGGGGGRGEGGEWKGDFALFDDGIQLRRTLFVTVCRVLLVQGVKVLGAACAAGLHRRHLMVWKIFAPRFIFEACSLMVVSASLLVVTLIVLRVDHSLTALTKSLQKAS